MLCAFRSSAIRRRHPADQWLDRKYPQFPQNEIFGLQDAFRKLDVEDKGYLDEATVIKATQQSERQPYDVVRQALKEVELDSSRRVELDDYVDVCSPTASGKGQPLSGGFEETDTAVVANLKGTGRIHRAGTHVNRTASRD